MATNNAYCQDNAISWFDWQAAQGPQAQQLTDFVARLIALRRASPSLAVQEFQHGSQLTPELRDIDWFSPAGVSMTPEDWSDGERRTFAVRRVTRVPEDHGRPAVLALELLLFNGSGEAAEFAIPTGKADWHVMPGKRRARPARLSGAARGAHSASAQCDGVARTYRGERAESTAQAKTESAAQAKAENRAQAKAERHAQADAEQEARSQTP